MSQDRTEGEPHLRLVPDPRGGDAVSPEVLDEALRAKAIETLQSLRQPDGTISNVHVRWMATLANVHPRTVRRWLKAGGPPVRKAERPTFKGAAVSNPLRAEFLRSRGNVSELARRLKDGRDLAQYGLEKAPSRRTLATWIEEDFSKQELVALRKGILPAKDLILRVRLNGGHPDTHTGETNPIEVNVDSKDLHVLAWRPGAAEGVPVVVTLAVVRRSNYIAGVHVSPKEDGTSTVYCLIDMLANYGQPDLIQLDNHTAKNADAVGDLISSLDRATQRNSHVRKPEHNGGAEAANGSLMRWLASRIGPSSDLPKDDRGRPLVDPNEFGLPYEVIVQRVYDAVDWHNNQSTIERLDYVTPADAEGRYGLQPDSVPTEFLVKRLPSKQVKVTAHGIKLDLKASHAAPAPFVCKELAALVGKQVTVHYAGSRPRYVWVMRDGEFVGIAVHVDTLSEEEKAGIAAEKARISHQIDSDHAFLVEELKRESLRHGEPPLAADPTTVPLPDQAAPDRDYSVLEEAS